MRLFFLLRTLRTRQSIPSLCRSSAAAGTAKYAEEKDYYDDPYEGVVVEKIT